MKATAILKGKIQPFVTRCTNTPTGKKIVDACYRADDYVGEKMVQVVNSPTYEKFCQGVGECVTDISRGIRDCKRSIEEQCPNATAAVKDFFRSFVK